MKLNEFLGFGNQPTALLCSSETSGETPIQIKIVSKKAIKEIISKNFSSASKGSDGLHIGTISTKDFLAALLLEQETRRMNRLVLVDLIEDILNSGAKSISYKTLD